MEALLLLGVILYIHRQMYMYMYVIAGTFVLVYTTVQCYHSYSASVGIYM